VKNGQQSKFKKKLKSSTRFDEHYVILLEYKNQDSAELKICPSKFGIPIIKHLIIIIIYASIHIVRNQLDKNHELQLQA